MGILHVMSEVSLKFEGLINIFEDLMHLYELILKTNDNRIHLKLKFKNKNKIIIFIFT